MKYVIIGAVAVGGFLAGVLVTLWGCTASDRQERVSRRAHESEMLALKDQTIADQDASIRSLHATVEIQDKHIRLLEGQPYEHH